MQGKIHPFIDSANKLEELPEGQHCALHMSVTTESPSTLPAALHTQAGKQSYRPAISKDKQHVLPPAPETPSLPQLRQPSSKIESSPDLWLAPFFAETDNKDVHKIRKFSSDLSCLSPSPREQQEVRLRGQKKKRCCKSSTRLAALGLLRGGFQSNICK